MKSKGAGLGVARPLEWLSCPPKVADGVPLFPRVAGKTVPVHCVVEAVCSVERSKRPAAVETDSYVIIPASTAFDDLVPVALAQLGYARDTAAAATGSVVIKNWKPLTFDKIADGPLVSVGDILGELTTVATLRIQIFR